MEGDDNFEALFTQRNFDIAITHELILSLQDKIQPLSELALKSDQYALYLLLQYSNYKILKGQSNSENPTQSTRNDATIPDEVAKAFLPDFETLEPQTKLAYLLCLRLHLLKPESFVFDYTIDAFNDENNYQTLPGEYLRNFAVDYFDMVKNDIDKIVGNIRNPKSSLIFASSLIESFLRIVLTENHRMLSNREIMILCLLTDVLTILLIIKPSAYFAWHYVCSKSLHLRLKLISKNLGDNIQETIKPFVEQLLSAVMQHEINFRGKEKLILLRTSRLKALQRYLSEFENPAVQEFAFKSSRDLSSKSTVHLLLELLTEDETFELCKTINLYIEPSHEIVNGRDNEKSSAVNKKLLALAISESMRTDNVESDLYGSLRAEHFDRSWRNITKFNNDDTVNYIFAGADIDQKSLQYFPPCRPLVSVYSSYDIFIDINQQLISNQGIDQIVSAIEREIPKVSIKYDKIEKRIEFKSEAQFLVPLASFKISNVESENVGFRYPRLVVAELSFSKTNMTTDVSTHWDSCKIGDPLYVLSVRPLNINVSHQYQLGIDDLDVRFRSGRILNAFDEKHRSLFDNTTKRVSKSQIVFWEIELQAEIYQTDLESVNREIYNEMNLVLFNKREITDFQLYLKNISSIRRNPTNRTEIEIHELLTGISSDEMVMDRKSYPVNADHLFNSLKQYNEFLATEESDLKYEWLEPTEFTKFNYVDLRKSMDRLGSCLNNRITLLNGVPRSGKSKLMSDLTQLLLKDSAETVLVVAPSKSSIENLMSYLTTDFSDLEYATKIVYLSSENSEHRFSLRNQINKLLAARLEYLKLVSVLSKVYNNIDIEFKSVELANSHFSLHLEQKLDSFVIDNENVRNDSLNTQFKDLLEIEITKAQLRLGDGTSLSERLTKLRNCIKTFEDLETFLAFDKRSEYIINFTSKCVFLTAEDYMKNFGHFTKMKNNFNSILLDDAQLMHESETACIIMANSNFQRLVLAGNDDNYRDLNFRFLNETLINLKSSLFDKLKRSDCSKIDLTVSIQSERGTSPEVLSLNISDYRRPIHIISDVNTRNGKSLLVSVDEIEFSVALFMYLVIKGCDRNDIVILCNSHQQVKTIRDNIAKKCGFFEKIGFPYVVCTLEEFEGRVSTVIIYSTSTDRSLRPDSLHSMINYAASRASSTFIMLSSSNLLVSNNLNLIDLVKPMQDLQLIDSVGKMTSVSSYNQLYNIIKEMLINY